MPEAQRHYEVVVLGATGFTGGLVAEALARRHGACGLRWAIAGRSHDKLERVRERLVAIDPACHDVGLIVADVEQPATLVEMAEQTAVVASTVGPFARYGEPVVEACVAAGADYADITGEPAFVGRVIGRFDHAARDAGLRAVCCCGFDSVPHDLGAWLAVGALGADEPIRLKGYVTGHGELSGGTWHSAVEAMGRWRTERADRRPLVRSPKVAVGRRVTGLPQRIHRARELGAWATPLPTIDPLIVLRSARLCAEYGPDFSYGHFVPVRSPVRLATGLLGVGTVATLAQLGPTRRLLLRLKAPGRGPDEAQRAKGRFRVRMQGRKKSGASVEVEVRGGDPGYGETANMLAESALCLARDRLPARFGVLTPAAAMGDALVARLRAVGMTFEVRSSAS